MKQIGTSLFKASFTILILVSFSVFSYAQNYDKDYMDGQLYFKYKDHISVSHIPVNPDRSVNPGDVPVLDNLRQSYGIESVERPFDLNYDHKLLRIFKLYISNPENIEEVIEALSNNPELEYAERVPAMYLDYTPNDDLYNLALGNGNWNWHHDVVNSEMAWDITQGSSDINIAIIDGAVWIDHEDLADDIFASKDITAPGNENSNPPASGDPEAWSHGTHCAGLAAASTDNVIGVAGLGFDCSIIGVKCTPDNGNPNLVYNGYGGIQWAANNGAHVISCSWGGSGSSASEQSLINTINGMGIVVMGSRGNQSSGQLRYPSCYNHVLGVAATNENDVKSDFSSYGTGTDFCAPGGYGTNGPTGLLSTTYDETSLGYYDSYFGTSMATPFAAGLVGLVLSLNPDLTPEEVEDIIESTCDNIDTIPGNSSWAGQLGAGRINAYEAVSNTPFAPTSDFMTPVPYITPGTQIEFTDLSIGVPDTWSWEFTGGSPTTSNQQNPSVTYDDEGVFTVSLFVSNSFGDDLLISEDYITVTSTPVPWVLFSADTNGACATTDVVSFSDESLYDPTEWLWEFSPNTVTFENGTSATMQDIQISFDEPGEYTVTLIATNENGTGDNTIENMVMVEGIMLNFEEDFEDGSTSSFRFSSNDKGNVGIDDRAANNSDFGLHFEGGGTTGGWTGGPTNTTPEEAWETNTGFHAFAENCHVDATGVEGVKLQLDLAQTFSIGNTYSWFRVLVNGEPVADFDGTVNFNPSTTSDPFETRTFDLSAYGNSGFTLTLQSACYLADGFGGTEGDNVFVDNMMITNFTSLEDEKQADPGVITYPNPARTHLNYTVVGMEQNYTVTLTDVRGKVVYSTDVQQSQQNQGKIAVGNFTPGLYVLSISNEQGVVTKKVMVE
jgi:subtilisin family serine protease